jgi:5-formyltetrahydrofolate cyclo-ligase
LITSELGTPEPARSAWKPAPAKTLDLIVVPGIAFDEDGYRLGYGGGVFDRLLTKAPKAVRVALGYERQLVPHLPRHQYDQQLDFLITERRVLRWPRKR